MFSVLGLILSVPFSTVTKARILPDLSSDRSFAGRHLCPEPLL